MAQIQNLRDVVEWGLCIGCGACAYACEQGAVRLVHHRSTGIRPEFIDVGCGDCSSCLPICPGHGVNADTVVQNRPRRTFSDHEFGPVLEIWEGHASDPEIRSRGSSGGALTALAAYALECEGAGFVVHSEMDPNAPTRNRTCRSSSRQELMSRAGSRYAPSSPCEGLGWIEEGEGRAVFIGKPCDVAAAQEARVRNRKLDEKLGLVLTFFCAGTPSEQGTFDLISSLGVDPEEVTELHYRGAGWPGRFQVSTDRASPAASMSYRESWGSLTGYRSLRCHLCVDGLGRMADISCGDGWHMYGEAESTGRDGAENTGWSLLLVNTERGREVVKGAIEAGYLSVAPSNADSVFDAQPLLERRRVVFGRLLALRALLIPVPKYKGFSLLRGFWHLSFEAKLRSVVGTMWRAVKRGWWRRRTLPGAKCE
ncbi:MAG: Coenzyme F420 hydrogenase/dehydrogenase, beta subunit C-terminal domain [Deltaproteobacteria bacterium]|nr:Coenzyme F420 hydrogenase/dehydrogenase, beta subunit C-terminal domain [Deltaproteobacteria bacterium]